MSMLPKHLMSEEDIKLQYITPAITAKWDISKITMETKLTDGKINLKGNLVVREKPKRADYVLYLAPNNPIAIIEAKDNNHSVSYGLQQAMAYAQMLDLPLPDDAAMYIANQLKSNIRQLEGVVKRMKAQYLLNNESPTMAAAQNAIRDIRNDNQPVPITVERIITEVARTMNVSPEDIRSNKQSAPVSRARQMAAYVVRTITNLPMKSIGEEFGGRDHTTIVYAIQKVEAQMAKDPNFRNMVNDIIKNISES